MAVLAVLDAVGAIQNKAEVYGEVWRSTMTEADRGSGLRGKWHSRGSMPVYVSDPGPLGYARPRDGFPVVIVAHHAVGIYHASFLRQFCDDLAEEGYLAVLPDLFHRVWSEEVPNGRDMPFDRMNIPAMLASQRDEDIVSDIYEVLRMLAVTPDYRSDLLRVAVLGFCMGGRIGWLAGVSASLSRSLRAVVSYHGGNVWKAYPDADDAGPGHRLSELGCPVLAHFGALDANPSPTDQRRLEEKAKAEGKHIEFHTYPGAKHGFACKDSANYMDVAAAESWKKTIEFLHRILARGPLPQRVDL